MAWKTCKKCQESYNNKKSLACPGCGEKMRKYKEEEMEKLDRQKAYETIVLQDQQKTLNELSMEDIVFRLRQLENIRLNVAVEMEILKKYIKENEDGTTKKIAK